MREGGSAGGGDGASGENPAFGWQGGEDGFAAGDEETDPIDVPLSWFYRGEVEKNTDRWVGAGPAGSRGMACFIGP